MTSGAERTAGRPAQDGPPRSDPGTAGAADAGGAGNTVDVRGLGKRFGYREALRDVSFTASAGECLAVCGRNGSGKSTLVRILATLASRSSGEVRVLGYPLPESGVDVRARLGVVLDHPLLPRDLSLAEGLGMTADLFGVPDADARIAAVAARFGIAARLDDPVRTFSRGMGQRAALCRAWLPDPDLLLLDEPTNGLDGPGCDALAAAIRDARGSGRTILLVTHDLAFAGRVADRAILLENGSLAAAGAPAEVFRRVRGEGAAA